MNTTNFLKQIRSIIREEIEYALDKKLNESKKRDEREVISHGMNLVNKANKVVKPQQKQASKPVKKTSLNSIQSLLEETRRSMQESMDEEYLGESGMMTEGFSSGTSAIPKGVNPNDLTPELTQALTRDYSALMAKITEKKGR